MLASPLVYPPSGFSEEASQYRPAKDMDAFNSLLPPPIEFVEGSSSGTLATAEGKYQPINGTPKPLTKGEALEAKRGILNGAAKTPPQLASTSVKSLYPGTIDATWPKGIVIGSGFNNMGNTCFLNSALQCLLHTPPLLRVLDVHTKLEPCRVKNAFCMTCALRQVMYESYGKKHPTTPYPITTKLQVIAKHMRRGRQEDSHEFLRYAIDALQKSCLAGYSPKIDPKLADTTWVHKIFGGRLRSRVTCLSCQHNSDTFDNMLDLSVDISGISSLREALRKFVAVDHLKGADKYKCEKCKRAVTADKQFTVDEAPLVLTIHLKRFSPMGRKIGHLIKYEERLSLQPVMSDGKHGPSYLLYGVISHAGGGPNSGHYYAHVKSASGQWFEMNDESVSRQHGPPTSLKNAYVLFYMRERGQALEAAVSVPSPRPFGVATATRPIIPAISPLLSQKVGLVAGMKKRKVVEGEEGEAKKRKVTPPFIGPRLPSPPPDVITTPVREIPLVDPQANTLKKKIAAAETAQGALLSLSQYDEDDDDDDVGEKVDKTEPEVQKTVEEPIVPSTPSTPAPPTTPAHASYNSLPSSANAFPAIPASIFYGAASNTKKHSDRKRKSPDQEEHDSSFSDWVRTPIQSNISITPAKKSFGSSLRSGANPWSKLNGSNNLQSRENPLHKYGKRKKRMIM